MAAKSSAVMVIRDRKTTALPPMQLGSFHKLFEPDEYEGKKRFKARFHVNAAAIGAMEKVLQVKCIDAHFDELKKQVAEVTAEAKEQRKTPPISLCDSKEDAQSPKEFMEDKLKEPHEKDKVQLPTIQLHVDAWQPLRKGQTEADRELRTIKFWDSAGNLLGDSENLPKELKRMAAGSWVKPVVHTNLFLSKQLGKAPRCQLMLVGLQIIKLEVFGAGQVDNPDGVDDDEMRKIMGDDYDHADDLSAMIGTGHLEGADALVPDDDEAPSPF
jgi:hypothetical protein